MKHTPGPWRFDPDNLNVYANGLLAQVYGHTHNGVRLANARLIAAAPALLAALKLAQSRLCEHCPQYTETSTEQVGEHTDECLAAMDTIAKAEGQLA